jgi:hypothetical protein
LPVAKEEAEVLQKCRSEPVLVRVTQRVALAIGLSGRVGWYVFERDFENGGEELGGSLCL